MKLSKFVTRRCGKCNNNIGKAWQGGSCPICEANVEKWHVKVDFTLRCPDCNFPITGRELSCSECGTQLPVVTVEHEQ